MDRFTDLAPDDSSTVVATLQRIDRQTPWAIKLAALSDMPTSPTIYDPLDNPAMGPRGTTDWASRGERWGKLIGTVGGAAIPLIAGQQIGQHMIDQGGAVNAAEGMTAAGLGGAAAIPGALVGRAAGGYGGHLIGRGLHALEPRERHIVDYVRHTNPVQAAAELQTIQRRNGYSAPEAAAFRDALNSRREGFGDQVRSGAL